MGEEKIIKGFFTGLTTLDYIYYVDSYPENNSKIKTASYRYYVGGPAANAAITYALLGGKAVLLTCLGRSEIANMIKGIVKSFGVELIDVYEGENLPNVASIVVDSEGKRTVFSGQGKIETVNIDNIMKNVPAKDVEALQNKEGGCFCLFDLNQQELALNLLDMVRCPVVLDAGSWKANADRFLKRADIIISSEGFLSPTGENIFEMKETEQAKKAITRGEKPILTENGSIDVLNTECVDSLGAGDIFHGAFCYGYFNEKMGFEEALAFSRDVATESVKHYGPRTWSSYIKAER